jgi:hypothetical protein
MAREATIRRVNPYELHGVRYYQLYVSYADTPDLVNELRLAHDVVYFEPAEGDRVSIDALLSVVTGVRKVTTEDRQP